jgi:ubiquinone/menaquinone biosynthesis C-methylase UbiE
MSGVKSKASSDSSLGTMSIQVCPLDKLSADKINMLQQKLVAYYTGPAPSYYVTADQAASQYTIQLQPFHCDLADRIRPGMTVLELGCGTAHLCRAVEERGGIYTGMDHSTALLDRNRGKFPRARFLQIGAELHQQFDLVASLYTIEHIADPPAYLDRMWKFCKPGGLIALICPDFVDGESFPPSFYYGQTPRRLREKLRSLALIDACQHLLDLFWFAPRWKACARSMAPGAFWINLEPRIFRGAEYSIDADAVHLARLKDLVWWLQNRGASIIATSRMLPHVDPSILKHNCYVLARRSR